MRLRLRLRLRLCFRLGTRSCLGVASDLLGLVLRAGCGTALVGVALVIVSANNIRDVGLLHGGS